MFYLSVNTILLCETFKFKCAYTLEFKPGGQLVVGILVVNAVWKKSSHTCIDLIWKCKLSFLAQNSSFNLLWLGSYDFFLKRGFSFRLKQRKRKNGSSAISVYNSLVIWELNCLLLCLKHWNLGLLVLTFSFLDWNWVCNQNVRIQWDF